MNTYVAVSTTIGESELVGMHTANATHHVTLRAAKGLGAGSIPLQMFRRRGWLNKTLCFKWQSRLGTNKIGEPSSRRCRW